MVCGATMFEYEFPPGESTGGQTEPWDIPRASLPPHAMPEPKREPGTMWEYAARVLIKKTTMVLPTAVVPSRVRLPLRFPTPNRETRRDIPLFAVQRRVPLPYGGRHPSGNRTRPQRTRVCLRPEYKALRTADARPPLSKRNRFLRDGGGQA